MRSPSAEEVLDTWERGVPGNPIERALVLLRLGPGASHPDGASRLTIGRRDAELLALREWLFGAEMAAVVACPRCKVELDLELDAAEIRSAAIEPPEGEMRLCAHGYEVTFRVPECADLEFLEDTDDEESWRQLLGRCVLSATRQDGEPLCGELPDEVVEAITAQMANSDPLADIRLALNCPACEHRWLAVFDIVSFLWREITSFARRLLREVHDLASVYGWSEKEILSLSYERRQYYLGLING
jgi:hypothetical protein